MRFRSSLPALAGLCFLAFVNGPALAQTANCTGVAQWSQSAIYNPGDRLVYQNRLYQATSNRGRIPLG